MFLAGAVAILSLAGTAATYTYEGATTVTKRIFWKDEVKVIAYNTAGDAVFLNSGSGSVFLETVSFSNDALNLHRYRELNRIVKAGEFCVITLAVPDRDDVTEVAVDVELTPASMEALTANGWSLELVDSDEQRLIAFVEFHKNRNKGEKISTAPVSGTLVFRSERSGEKKSVNFQSRVFFGKFREKRPTV